ncbi:MAG: 7-cyano-7-deazaguanine synthase QueC [Desulfobacterales bacterium]
MPDVTFEKKKKAVVLSSGGIDSTTAMAMAKDMGFSIYSLTVNYGQRHRQELAAARNVAEALGVEIHMVMDLDLRSIGGSALTDDIPVPKSVSRQSGIPATYVPARNTIFLSLALSWAEVLTCGDIFIGVNAIDYSGYPDCRPEYIQSFEKMANLALKAAVEGRITVCIQAPLIHMTKAQIIETGIRFGVDYSLTHSCYHPDPTGAACGVCDSCMIRKKGFSDAGVPDPTRYAL